MVEDGYAHDSHAITSQVSPPANHEVNPDGISPDVGGHHHSDRQHQGVDKAPMAKELIDATVADLAQTELQRAHAVWQKKFGEPPSNAKEYAKQTRFMAYRGFSFDIIKQVIRGDTDLMDESL